MGIESIYQLQLAFFGLRIDTVPEARAAIFTQIHEICFHGQGGYDWNTVYNMPLWLRRFTFNKIKEYHEKQNESNENEENTLVSSDGKINVPKFIQNQPKKPVSYK